MTIEGMISSLSEASPPARLDPALEALWWAGKGQWERAHGVVQQHEGNPDCDLVHAHLHRQEGDLANARHWYRVAGRPMPDVTVKEEWTAVATSLLG